MSWPSADNDEVTVDADWITVDSGAGSPPSPPATPLYSSEQYLDLITAFHRGKPKFSAMIRALVEPVVGQINFKQHLPLDFDIDEAVGVQLDAVGEWVGRSRFVGTPISGVFFTFDHPGRGFDQGVWFRPQYDTPAGVTRLDDDTYRTLLRAKIAANSWDGTLPAAKSALEIIFPSGETTIIVTDNQDMTITFAVAGQIPSMLFIALLSDGYIPLKPEGVRANYVVTTVDGPVFGFDVQNDLISGFDAGAWGATPSYFAT